MNSASGLAGPVLRLLVFCLLFGLGLRLSAQIAPADLPNLELTTGGEVNAMVLAPDGKLILGGNFTKVNGVPRHHLVRLNPEGTVDLSWDPHPDGPVYALALSATDLFVGGAFHSIGGQARNGVAKLPLDGTGSADPAWDAGADGPTYVLTVAEPYLYFAGEFFRVQNITRWFVARVITTGSATLEQQWNPDPDGPVQAIAVDGSEIYVGGEFSRIGQKNRNGLARLDSFVGFADPTWAPEPSGAVYALALDPANLYVAGLFDSIAGESRRNLARLTKGGVLDLDWDPAPDDRVSGIILNQEAALAWGAFTQIGGAVRVGVAKLLLPGTGVADSNWNSDFSGPARPFVSAVTWSGPDLFVGGKFRFAGGNLALGTAKLDALTGASTPAANVQLPGEAKTIVRQPNGKILVGGDFLIAGGVPKLNLTRLNADGTIDAGFTPGINGPVFALAADASAIYAGGSFTQVNGVARTNLVKLDGAQQDEVDLTWNPNPEGGYVISTLALSTNSLYVGGTFTHIAGQLRHNLAKLSVRDFGEADPAWAPGTDSTAGGEIDKLVVVGNDLYVAGSFATMGGAFRNTLARIDAGAAGNADLDWVPNPPAAVTEFAINGTDLYAVGGDHIFRISLTNSGALSPGWVTVANESVHTIHIQGDYLYAGGVFDSIGGLARRGLARVSLSGTGWGDATWDRSLTDPAGSISSLLMDAGGIYVGGRFTQIAGVSRGGLAFLPELHPPIVTSDSTHVYIVPDPLDLADVNFFRVLDIFGLSLFFPDGVTQVRVGDFLTVAQGQAGLLYYGSGLLTVVAALDQSLTGTGTENAAVAVIDPPLQPPVLLSGPKVLGNGAISVELHGPNATYSIQGVQDLRAADWRELLRVTNSVGVVSFNYLPQPSDLPQFYRAVSLP